MMTTTTSTSHRSSSSADVALAVGRAHGRELHIRCSTRADGDFHRTEVPIVELERRRRSLVDLPWTQLDEQHGIRVVRVEAPGDGDGDVGDVAITRLDDAVLGCWAGDCAPVVLMGGGCEFAVVHAGWRGLALGVVQAACDSFREPLVRAWLGPAIGPCCYEFGRSDLASVAAGVGATVDQIAGRTRAGRRALDVPAAVNAAVRSACGDIPVVSIGGCTGCRFPGFSHRVRRDPQRHVVAAWQVTDASRTRPGASHSAGMDP